MIPARVAAALLSNSVGNGQYATLAPLADVDEPRLRKTASIDCKVSASSVIRTLAVRCCKLEYMSLQQSRQSEEEA